MRRRLLLNDCWSSCRYGNKQSMACWPLVRANRVTTGCLFRCRTVCAKDRRQGCRLRPKSGNIETKLCCIRWIDSFSGRYIVPSIALKVSVPRSCTVSLYKGAAPVCDVPKTPFALCSFSPVVSLLFRRAGNERSECWPLQLPALTTLIRLPIDQGALQYTSPFYVWKI